MAKDQRCTMECVDKDGEPRMARATLPTCEVCGNNLSGWLRRRLAERMKYRDTLSLRARRMQFVTTEKKEGEFSVIDIRPHLKRRKAQKAKRSA
jgi:macrodomain Ter protein organizer (MatP/YcbG family)